MSALYPDRQDMEPANYCEECWGEVYTDERLYNWNGQMICIDCLKMKVNQLLQDDPALLAAELQIDTVRV